MTGRKPPSYFKYMAANPAITIHVSKDIKDRIDKSKATQSYGAFVRALMENFEAEVEKRVQQVRQSTEVAYPCDVCGRPLVLRPGGPDTQVAIACLKERGWGHEECHKQQRRYPVVTRWTMNSVKKAI